MIASGSISRLINEIRLIKNVVQLLRWFCCVIDVCEVLLRVVLPFFMFAVSCHDV